MPLLQKGAEAPVSPISDRGSRLVLAPPPSKGKGRGAAILIGLFVVLTLAGLLSWRRAQQAAQTAGKAFPSIRTAKVRVGPLEQTLRLSGLTVAENHAVLMAPSMPGRRGSSNHHSLVLEKVAEPGLQAKKGDVVAEFDRQYMLTRLDDYRAAVVQDVADVRKMEATLGLKRKAYEQQILSSKGRLDKAELELRTGPVRSAIEVERMRLLRDEAAAVYQSLIAEMPLMTASERAGIRRTELQLKESELEAKRAGINAEKMIARAPIDGMVVMQSTYRDGQRMQIGAGDQLRSGQPYMQIVDLGSMMVHAEVNQADFELIREGMPARVHFDAFTDLELPGKLTSIAALAVSRGFRANYVKHIPVRVKIEKMDPRVIPNFSVGVDVILAREEKAPIVPREAVFEDPSGQTAFAFVKAGTGWEKRELELGLASNTEVAVHSGLNEGEVIAAEWPPEIPGQ